MVKSKVIKKRKIKAPEKKINPEILKKLIKEKKSERIEFEEETLEEVVQEPEIFVTPETFLTKKSRILKNIEKTFQVQDYPEDFSLENSIAGVEVIKKDSKEQEFYNTISDGAKTEDFTYRYGSPIQSTGIQIRQREVGPLTTADIRLRQNKMTGINYGVMTEMKKYASQDPDQKYDTKNLQRIDPYDINRDKGRNSLLHEVERVEVRYE